MTGGRALRYPGAWLQAGTCAGLLTVLAVLVADTTAPGRVDVALSAVVTGSTPWRSAAFAVDWFGEPLGVLLVVALVSAMLLATGRVRHVVVLVAAQGAVFVVGGLLKSVVGRTIHGDALSFPSGHTAGAAAWVLVVTLFLADVGGLRGPLRAVVVVLPALGAGLVAGWAQTVLSAHYPTDALGGILLAFVLVPVLAQATDRTGRLVAAPR